MGVRVAPPGRCTVTKQVTFRMATQKIRKAVFPVAGLGTRFLPATKAVAKELLPVVDRPLIQYAVDEALEAGIETLIFVTGRGKGAIEDHFDVAFELERIQADRGKPLAALEGTRLTPGNALFVRQQEPRGLGHAIWCAREVIGNDPFAIILPDELLIGREKGCLAQMVDHYERVGGNLVCALEVPMAETPSYGVIDPGRSLGALTEVRGLVEKPAPGTAPSNLMLPGRYILQPEVIGLLAKQEAGAGGEVQLTDAMAKLIGVQPFHGVTFDGERFDCGSKIGYAQANFALASRDVDMGAALRDWARTLLE